MLRASVVSAFSSPPGGERFDMQLMSMVACRVPMASAGCETGSMLPNAMHLW